MSFFWMHKEKRSGFHCRWVVGVAWARANWLKTHFSDLFKSQFLLLLSWMGSLCYGPYCPVSFWWNGYSFFFFSDNSFCSLCPYVFCFCLSNFKFVIIPTIYIGTHRYHLSWQRKPSKGQFLFLFVFPSPPF